MSSFAGLTNAAAALSAQRYAMDVTGQNISNADTPGYVRERANLQATGPVVGVPTMYATSRPGVGTANANGVTRLNDPVLDARARSEHATGNYLDTKAAALSDVETNFDEPSDNGLAEQLNKFWNSWSTVANNPGDTASRTALLKQASTVVTSLNSISASLTQTSTDAQSALSASVTQINTAASSVATLNAAIKVASATGGSTAALEDQRDSLLMTLASVGGAQSQVQSDGSITVTMGGQTLVSGNAASGVALDASHNVTVGGTAVTLTGGSAQAQVETINTTIPAYLSQLDGIASALVSSVNTIHQTGYDLNGAAGGAFFSGTTAATITVAITDPNQVAASATGSGTADLDASVAQKLAALGSSKTGADAAYSNMVSTVGSDSARATQQSTIQASVTSSVDNLQQQASGVSYDDEVTNLLTFQRAYQASSRVLSTIDSCLDTLINSTGR